jgi:hypothetical protein
VRRCIAHFFPRLTRPRRLTLVLFFSYPQHKHKEEYSVIRGRTFYVGMQRALMCLR